MKAPKIVMASFFALPTIGRGCKKDFDQKENLMLLQRRESI